MSLNTKFLKDNLYQISGLIIFLAALYFAAFHWLDKKPIVIWDESLFALRALHIHLFGSYMPNFNQFEGLPFHLNTKLPLTTYFQVLSFKLFGVNEFALRLPIPVIFTFTSLYVLYYFTKEHKQFWAGLVFGMIAISSIGFVKPHMLRTGDQDAAYACFLLLTLINFLQYLNHRRVINLVGFAIFSICAVLTKNLLAGLLAPGLLLFLILNKQFIALIKDIRFIAACLAIVLTYAGVVGYFELQFPGFIKQMWGYELMGRYTNTIENHEYSAFNYLKIMAFNGFQPYIFLLIPFTAIALRADVSSAIKRGVLCSITVFITYLIIISLSETKLDWYIAPLYLVGAYLLSLASVPLFNQLNKQKKFFKITIVAGLLFGWLILYSQVLNNNFNQSVYNKDEYYGSYLKKLRKSNKIPAQLKLVDSNFGSAACFYAHMYAINQPQLNIAYQRNHDLEPGEIIMSCLNKDLVPITDMYQTQEIDNYGYCKLLKIISKKVDLAKIK